MRIATLFLFVYFYFCSNIFLVVAQDDETRRATGLPMKIGENSANTNKGNLSGKISLQGLDSSQPKPTIYVSVFYSGVLVDRRVATETGDYFIPGIPRENVVVVVELNGVEVGRQQIPTSVLGNIRQDFTINMFQAKTANSVSPVISEKDLYQRSKENEKIFEEALSFLRNKKRDFAINLFKQIVAKDPKDFVVWTELGNLYFRNENFAEAEQYYIKALEQNIEFMAALINLGKLYLNQKQAEKAILILSKAVEVKPLSADSQHLLGEAYLLAKKGSKGVVHLNEALRLEPIERAEIHLRLAALYNAAGLREKTAEEYKQFLIKFPNYPEKEKLEKYIKENSPK